MVRHLLMLLVIGMLCAGCAHFYGLVETDAEVVSGCALIGTFAETANPGREDGGVLKHYVDTTGVKQRVLQRSAEAGATHVVWMHTYSMAAAAQAYRCPAPEPPVSIAAGADGIWEEDLP
jgi:hypothetical protein